jgi:hypothetical protein
MKLSFKYFVEQNYRRQFIAKNELKNYYCLKYPWFNSVINNNLIRIIFWAFPLKKRSGFSLQSFLIRQKANQKSIFAAIPNARSK